MKITVTETTIECTAKELKESNTLSDRLNVLLKQLFTQCTAYDDSEDEDIDNILATVSKSQAYKQFGNSIVVPVLMAIFSQLGISGVKKWNDMTEDEIYKLIGRYDDRTEQHSRV